MDSTNKKYVVTISDEAAQMLVSHARFAALVSETAAFRLVEEFEEKTKSLENFPERNPWLDDPLIARRKYRKLLMAKRYMLVYQIKSSTVHIDAVVDCRQDYSWLL
jgi:plasmid stabilization system protein ParE